MMLPQSQFPAGKLKGWPCVLLEGWALSSQPRELWVCTILTGRRQGSPGRTRQGWTEATAASEQGAVRGAPPPASTAFLLAPCPAPASLLVGHL